MPLEQQVSEHLQYLMERAIAGDAMAHRTLGLISLLLDRIPDDDGDGPKGGQTIIDLEAYRLRLVA